jgi:hypothetical protein
VWPTALDESHPRLRRCRESEKNYQNNNVSLDKLDYVMYRIARKRTSGIAREGDSAARLR